MADDLTKDFEDIENNQTEENPDLNLDDDTILDELDSDLTEEKEEVENKTEEDGEKTPNLDFILDIPLKLTVELGRTKLLINDLLQLGQGSVIELDKLAGEPLEVLVNDKLIARGEAVVVNEKFGVRITDILSPMDRVEKLSE